MNPPASLNLWRNPELVERVLASGDGAGVRIAIIDSGIDTSHPDPLIQNLELKDDLAFSDRLGEIHCEEGKGLDVYGHGTAVAYCIRQIAPAAEIGSFRVLNARLGSRNFLIRTGAMKAIELGYNILNCSFGCRDDTGKHAMTYKEWLDEAYLRKIHVVTACNNDNFNIQEWPGFFHSCINVNMLDRPEGRFSFRPDHLVEFGAEGVDVRLPWKGGSYKSVSGSSFAAPVVTGHLAKLLSAFPDLTPIQAKALLQAHADVHSQTSTPTPSV